MSDTLTLPAPIIPTALYDTEQTAYLLAASYSFVTQLMTDKKIRVRKVGRLTRVLGQDILDYLDSVVIRTDEELLASVPATSRPGRRFA